MTDMMMGAEAAPLRLSSDFASAAVGREAEAWRPEACHAQWPPNFRKVNADARIALIDGRG